MSEPTPTRTGMQPPRRPATPVRAVRRSLATRMALMATVAGVILIVVLLNVVNLRIANAVYEDRKDTILVDAWERVTIAQQAFDDSSATTTDEVSSVVEDEVADIRQSSSGAGVVGVVMKRSPQESAPQIINDVSTGEVPLSLVTDELRERVASGSDGKQYYEWVTITDEAGSVPGLVVGSRVSLPVAGTYEMYIVYSLAPEERVIERTTKTVFIAGTGFLLILILGVWALTWRVLIPIRRTSLAAQRLAAGRLNERLVVQGDDEIAALSRSFNDMAASLESQIEAWENLSKVEKLFVSDVSHELRTPLASIRLASEQIWAARDEIEDPFAARSIEILMREVDRFEEMLSDLLEISRIDSGRVQLRAEDADLVAVLRGVLDLVAVHIEAKGSQIRIEAPAEPVVAEVDTTRVERILRNLVVNALEHAEGSPIDITVAAGQDAVAVRVRDHGVGMSPDVVKKVFDRFYRADPSRRRTLGGTGLGLSISLEDASLHGGTITAWGWPADGASFLLVLPRSLGPGGAPGTYTLPGPLDVVPDDAPEVARATSRRGGAAGEASAAPGGTLAPAPASRRSDVVRESGQETDTRDGEQVAGPRRVTVVGPGDAPSARTPEDNGGRGRPEGRR
ncbi:MAG: MtrAB system histidine kinase MtrB [Actinomyces sp.]|uniref:MtrAB system histidine kinase MtrB n=1 Tax=Actinomyces sp. TaxID=29317 RepID=UPI0026DC1F0F|nr:MtrAB system histidine kinase MtrB [Actinomyces sp.]MDO4242271.1 MtrAB system histidine kinase MtrB [Actinomyces sp.]